MVRAPHIGSTLLVACIWVASCNGGGVTNGTPISASVQLSWVANREKDVNGPGGGYKVYYSSVSGFDVATAVVINVPYNASAGAVPTSTAVNLSSGTYYFKVAGYSSLNPNGTASAQLQVNVPFGP